jgi:hypothetical protein
MDERRGSAIAAVCECADCRQYRLWRAEGSDEWLPDPDAWKARAMAFEPGVIDQDARRDVRPADVPAD